MLANLSCVKLVAFVEKHKASLIGVECTAEEYEAAVKPAVAAIKAAQHSREARIDEIFRLAEQLVGRGDFDIHVWAEEDEEVIVEYCGMQAWFDRDGFAVLQTEVSSAATIPGLCEFASICDRLNKWIQATGATP